MVGVGVLLQAVAVLDVLRNLHATNRGIEESAHVQYAALPMKHERTSLRMVSAPRESE